MIQNQLDTSQLEYGTMRNTIQTLESSLESLRSDIQVKDNELITKCQENSSLLATIDELQNKCRLAQVCAVLSISAATLSTVLYCTVLIINTDAYIIQSQL